MNEQAPAFFHPGGSARGKTTECFKVQNECFCYSINVSPAFNDTAAGGGPIRAGLWVRIRHVHGVIVQLETENT